MMYNIRELEKHELSDFVEIASTAYPGMGIYTEEAKAGLIEKLEKQISTNHKKLYGCFKEEDLVGGMMLHDFIMNFHGKQIEVGGLGFVAVSLLHKKEKVAKNLVIFFEKHYKDRNIPITALYPFRPDFYKKMGYGYGAKMNKYIFAPEQLPKGKLKKDLVRLSEQSIPDMHKCYTTYMHDTHGMMARTEEMMSISFLNPKIMSYGVMEGTELTGYCSFTFEPENTTNFLSNNLIIKEFVYVTPEAMARLCMFLHSQQDQVHRIVWYSQDENLHFLLHDPRNGSDNIMPHVYHENSVTGVGLMYKILEPKILFQFMEEGCFGEGDMIVKWNICHSFNGETSTFTTKFNNGKPIITNEEEDLQVDISINEFSSLLMGAIDVDSLYRYGLISVSDKSKLVLLRTLFYHFPKPICMTGF
ncbi:GNAT family N-acetyltransferase [Sutcliffiella rhizosphaerae]|uniref:N-acetyltransferase Eis n=1 Tax=Sutcliffiella rhizosphaerae TaxID=2880967 RepID=A0ABM8YJ66_9BACI|nr:GNAT family N-acetyltransferase [Sutcliffiella rhizosphaerae]CAG9619937.1 N-acetyltransferase Eis [Sutcliffiella rhizosphaerae]